MNKIKLTAIVNGEEKVHETDSWIELRGWLNELHELGFEAVSGIQLNQVDEGKS